MRHGRFALAGSVGAALLVLPLAAPPTAAQGQDPASTLYRLRAETTYQEGCFPPCACPLVIVPLEGSFRLEDAGFDGLFRNFRLLDIGWTVRGGPGPDFDVHIRGSGRYRVGGEFAVQQQLTLELQINGGPPQVFDSGLVTAAVAFPRIDALVSVGNLVCHDQAISFHARPAPQLRASRDGLFWSPIVGATSFDLVAGNLRALRASGGDFFESQPYCVANDTEATSVPFDADLGTDQAVWYLLRYNGSFGPDSYDTDLSSQRGPRDPGINAAPASCPP